MSLPFHISLLFSFFLPFLACKEVSEPKVSSAIQESTVLNSRIVTLDSTLLKKLPRLNGTWKGTGADRDKTFSWVFSDGQLVGNCLETRQGKVRNSSIFRFKIDSGAVCCYPSNSNGKCGTPEGTYRLTKQTDSSYIFLADNDPRNKTISTIEFAFGPNNRISVRRKHDRQDYPDSDIVRYFQRQ